MPKLSAADILCYSQAKQHAGTIRRYYLAWRAQNGIPLRCDDVECLFHTQPPVWKERELKLTLDHTKGVNSDNRVENLRLLCPNCDSQLSDTRGGANKGKIEKSAGGFAQRSKETGLRAVTLPTRPGAYSVTLNPPPAANKPG